SPAGPGIGLALGPGSEVLGISPCLLPYEFCVGMAYCGTQVGVGLMLQVDLENLQSEGHIGVRVESILEGASCGPCTVYPSTMKVEKVGKRNWMSIENHVGGT
ncbi:hypothetical protein A6R68_15791, partial [Neotoma lepida]